MIERPSGKVLATMVEHRSRYTFFGLAESKEAKEDVVKLLEALFTRKEKVETVVFNKSKEFALYELLADLLDAKTYFTHPYSFW